MNSLANVVSGTELAQTGPDPFLSYGQSVSTPQGQYLVFDKGHWLYGQDKIELALGSKFAANMAGFRRGWKRWEGGKVTEELMNLLVDMVQVPSRASLGDMDEGLWDRNDDGSGRDPWQQVSEVQLMDNAGNIYIYSTSSHGGRTCLGKLCIEYGQQYRQRPGQMPIVQIGGDSYAHRDTKRGRINVPTLVITDWTDENVLAIEGGPDVTNRAAAALPYDDDIPFPIERKPDSLADNASAGAQARGSSRAAIPPQQMAPASIKRGARF